MTEGVCGSEGGHGDAVLVVSAAEVCENMAAHKQSHFRQCILAVGFIFAPFCSCAAWSPTCTCLLLFFPRLRSIVFLPNRSLANFLLSSYFGFFFLMLVFFSSFLFFVSPASVFVFSPPSSLVVWKPCNSPFQRLGSSLISSTVPMLVHAQPWHSKALPACVMCTEDLSTHQFSLFQTSPSAPKPYCCCSGSIWMWASGCGPGGGYEKMAESACSTDGTSLRASPSSHVGHYLRKLTVRTPSKHALLLINIKGYFLSLCRSVRSAVVCLWPSLCCSLLFSPSPCSPCSSNASRLICVANWARQ